MNLLQKLFQFFRNLIGPKTTKAPKTITTNLKTLKTAKPDKIPSSNKISDKPSSSIQIKQVEQIPETVTPLATKITVLFCAKDRHWTFSNSKKSTPKLESGYIVDANTLMDYEDYPEIKKYGRKIVNKLRNEPIYVLSTSKREYVGKKCPKNKPFADDSKFLHEQVLDIPYTGKPRDFNATLNSFLQSLNVPIYYVKIESSSEVRRRAKELLPDLKMFGLHEPDNIYLAFTQATKSTLITSDINLIKCCKFAPKLLKYIEFHTLIEKIMQPSPITKVLRKRREYYKDKDYHSSWRHGVFKQQYKKKKEKTNRKI